MVFVEKRMEVAYAQVHFDPLPPRAIQILGNYGAPVLLYMKQPIDSFCFQQNHTLGGL